MQATKQRTERRESARLRELGALVLMLVAMPLITSCGGSGDGGGEGNGGGQGEGGQAANDGGGGNGAQGGTTGKPGNKPITSLLAVIASPDKKSLNGKRVRIRDAQVRGAVSERAFFVGESETEQLLVVNVGDAVEVTEGQEALVAGSLNAPRPELEERLSLTPQEAAAVNDQEIFLRARRVSPQEN